MTLLTEYDEEASFRGWRRDGRLEQAEESAKNLLRLNKLLTEEIASCCSLPVEKYPSNLTS